MAASSKNKPPENFVRWYGEFCLDEDEKKVTSRYKLATAVAKELTPETLLVLLRVVFGEREDGQVLSAATNIFQAYDNLFVVYSNERETEVLSAIALGLALENSYEQALRIAISIVTASFSGGRRVIDTQVDLLSLADQAINRISLEQRKRYKVNPPDGSALEQLLEIQANRSATTDSEENEETDESEEENDPVAIDASTIDDIISAAISLAETTRTFSEAVLSRLEVQDEELEILWWLESGCLEGTTLTFDTIPEIQRSLVLANELASKINLAPGPKSIESILLKACVPDNKVTVPAVVEAVSSSPHAKFTSSNLCILTMPIHSALSSWKEVNGLKSWKESWSAKTKISKSHSLPAVQLSKLFYFEKLLLRSIL